MFCTCFQVRYKVQGFAHKVLHKVYIWACFFKYVYTHFILSVPVFELWKPLQSTYS